MESGFSSERGKRRLHFIARVRITCLRRCCDTLRENLLCLKNLPELREELAKLEIPGDVFRMRGEKLAKVFGRCRIVAQFRAFERQAVARKSITRV